MEPERVETTDSDAQPAEQSCSRFAIFTDCPFCGEAMAPEHAHYRCTGCGWRDSCCD